MSRGELELYFQIKTDCWRLMKKYQNVEDNDLYWTPLIQEAQQIYKKYQTEFAKKEILNILNELERICKT